ncbi:MAG: hypothetical protein ACMUIE_05820 [Thermoplasmatota archaeon]
MNRERKVLLVLSVLISLLVISVIFIGLGSRDWNDNEEGFADDHEEPDVILDFLNMTVIDVFSTDRVTTWVTPPLFTMEFIVLNVIIENPLTRDVVISTSLIDLETTMAVYQPTNVSEFIGLGFGEYEVLPAKGDLSGFIFYTVYPNETLLGLSYEERLYNTTFDADLTNMEPEFRPWKTPLEFRVTGCGRDMNGSGREQFLYFNLEVTNPTLNSTHFPVWLIDMTCHNGVHLDVLLISHEENQDPFEAGWNKTFKLYFDIPSGSPDLPRILYQDDEGMYMEIPSSLYEGLI